VGTCGAEGRKIKKVAVSIASALSSDSLTPRRRPHLSFGLRLWLRLWLRLLASALGFGSWLRLLASALGFGFWLRRPRPARESPKLFASRRYAKAPAFLGPRAAPTPPPPPPPPKPRRRNFRPASTNHRGHSFGTRLQTAHARTFASLRNIWPGPARGICLQTLLLSAEALPCGAQLISPSTPPPKALDLSPE
jgi:hypothetical protein